MLSFIRNKLTCRRFTIVPIVCLITILTYGNILPESLRDNIVYIIWGLVILECFATCKLRFSQKSITVIALGGVFFFLVLLLTLFGPDNHYFSSSIVSTFGICQMLFFCGCALGNKFNEDDVEVVCRWFVIGAVVMGSFWFFQNIANRFNLASRIYSNVSFNKNSASQLISSAVCILIIGINHNKQKKATIIRILLAIYLTLILFLMRSRACIFCFAVAIFIMLMSRYTNKNVKRWIYRILIIAAIVLLLNANLRTILVQQILFANRDATDLNNLTSGRINIYSQFWGLVKGHELIGNGKFYYECFYLSAIVQFGFPVGLYLWYYVIHMLKTLKKIYISFRYGLLLMILAISYSLNGIFEGLSPFGPGTKNFFLWLLFGIATTHILYNSRDNERIVVS